MKNENKSESRLMRACIKIGTTILMSFLWFVCSLPLVTIGASSAAIYRVMFDMREGKPCTVKSFFAAFVKKLVPGTLCWIILLLVGVVLRGVPSVLAAFQNDIVIAVGLALTGALFLLLFVVIVCVFPLCAYYSTSLKKTIRNAVFVATHNGKQSILTSLLTAVPLIVFLIDPIIFLYSSGFWAVLYPGVVFYLGAKMFLPVFEEYDRRREEKAAEEAKQEED